MFFIKIIFYHTSPTCFPANFFKPKVAPQAFSKKAYVFPRGVSVIFFMSKKKDCPRERDKKYIHFLFAKLGKVCAIYRSWTKALQKCGETLKKHQNFGHKWRETLVQIFINKCKNINQKHLHILWKVLSLWITMTIQNIGSKIETHSK